MLSKTMLDPKKFLWYQKVLALKIILGSKNILVLNFVGQFMDRKRDWISKIFWDQYFWDPKKFEFIFFGTNNY